MYVRATSTRLSRGMSTPAIRAMAASPSGVVRRCGASAGARASEPEVSPLAGSGRFLAVLLDLLSCGLPRLAACPGPRGPRRQGCEGQKWPSLSALTLLVARVALADDHHAAVATDDLAVVADGLDARVDL